jgi:hypothetical protein
VESLRDIGDPAQLADAKGFASFWAFLGGVALAIVALPVYFIRSRGWKRGSISIVKGIVVVAAITLLGMLGEAIGKAMTS